MFCFRGTTRPPPTRIPPSSQLTIFATATVDNFFFFPCHTVLSSLSCEKKKKEYRRRLPWCNGLVVKKMVQTACCYTETCMYQGSRSVCWGSERGGGGSSWLVVRKGAQLLIATWDNSSLFVCHFSFIRGLAAPPAPPGCWPGSDGIFLLPPAGEPTAYPSISSMGAMLTNDSNSAVSGWCVSSQEIFMGCQS